MAEGSTDGDHIIPGTEHDVLILRGEQPNYKAIADASLATTVSLGETKTTCSQQENCGAHQHDDRLGDSEGNGLLATVHSSDVRCSIGECPKALANLFELTEKFFEE